MAHLATGKPAPEEWLEFVLMDRFKWTPDELHSIPLDCLLPILTMMRAEHKSNRVR